MLYEKFFKMAEKDRWQLETDIPWSAVNSGLALSQPEILESLRSAALIESYAPMYALKGLEVWWDDLEISAIASTQFYEEYKHYYVLKRYLEPLGYGVPDREILEARQKNFGTHYPDRIKQLANYFMSEHFTAHFYMRLLEQAQEPVLKVILNFLMLDEFRHCNIFYALLERRIQSDPSVTKTILEEAINFRHQGTEVVGEHMPVAEKNDFETFVLFIKKVERLTGANLSRYKKSLSTVQSVQEQVAIIK
jgi:hypothetical protein